MRITVITAAAALAFTALAGAVIAEEGPAAKELREKREAFMKKAPEEKIRLYEKGIAEVRAAGVEGKALNIGDTAPDFALPGADGVYTHLSDLLADGPVVLTWYRGGWCPYCNIYLRHLQTVLPELRAAGAELVAISPEKPDKTAETEEQNALGFYVLSDAGNKTASAYGISYVLPDYIAESYNAAFDLAEYNGDESYVLPLSATYVINEDGIITYAFIDADYRKRAEPSEVLEEVKKLNGEES